MKNLQKGFGVMVVLIIMALLAVAGEGVYLAVKQKPKIVTTLETSTPSSQNDNQTTSQTNTVAPVPIPNNGHFSIIYPNGGEKLEVGKTYDIKWRNYKGKEPITIELQSIFDNGQSSYGTLVANLPASQSGIYKWKVESLDSKLKYKIALFDKDRNILEESDTVFAINDAPIPPKVIVYQEVITKNDVLTCLKLPLNYSTISDKIPVLPSWEEDRGNSIATADDLEEHRRILDNNRKYVDAVNTLSSRQLFNLFRQKSESGVYSNSTSFVVSSLENKLRNELYENSCITYKEIRNYIADNTKDAKIRGNLLFAMGTTATVPSVSIVIENINNFRGPDGIFFNTQPNTLEAIATDRWNGKFHEELSPLLEDVYKTSTDSVIISHLAITIAKIGAPSGIKLLLNDILSSFSTKVEFDSKMTMLSKQEPTNIKDIKGFMAVAALSEYVRNPNSIPVLTQGLRDQKVDNFELIISGGTLAAMGKSEATKAIIDWAKGADSSLAPLVKSWILKMRDTASRDFVKKTIADNEIFKNIAVKNAVKDALDYVITH